MREGLIMELNKIKQGVPDESLQQVIANFGPHLREATNDGLVFAEKLQAALEQEMADHLVMTEVIQMVDPIIEIGVSNVMNRLQSRGFAAPGAVKDRYLIRYVSRDIRLHQRKNIHQSYVNNELKKRFQEIINSDIALPSLDALSQFQTLIINPKINKIILDKIEAFRRKNPQFSQCGANVLAATVVGSLKAKVKVMARQYLDGMSTTSDAIDDQAVIDYVMDSLDKTLPKTIEKEAYEQRDFESGMFLDSEAFNDVKVRIESSIHSIIMKDLQNLHKPQED